MKPMHTYTAYIAAPLKRVWQALLDPEDTERYFYGTRVESDWAPGSTVEYTGGGGWKAATGKVIAIDEMNRLEMTFHPLWDPELEAEGPTREVWLVEEEDGLTKLTVELYEAGPKTMDDFISGFPMIFSGLKTLLETGSPMRS